MPVPHILVVTFNLPEENFYSLDKTNKIIENYDVTFQDIIDYKVWRKSIVSNVNFTKEFKFRKMQKVIENKTKKLNKQGKVTKSDFVNAVLWKYKNLPKIDEIK